MKNFFKTLMFVVALTATTNFYSQVDLINDYDGEDLEIDIETPKCCDFKPSYYVAAGLSMTNSGDFTDSSYWSVEGGLSIDNFSAGLVFGRNNLTNTLKDDSFKNYWTEAKVSASTRLGVVDGYLLAGVGTYLSDGSLFIEYGGGVTKYFNHLGVFVQASNWDGAFYITPGVSYTF